jgi:hypothetical protein
MWPDAYPRIYEHLPVLRRSQPRTAVDNGNNGDAANAPLRSSRG